mmetsp:Transcript_23777/g.51923  ORF Transcript_23777/g.51923 Transcript_23777/m.51923 type:complete len:218 (+) Transcript_23777:1399-2052(+)
MRSAEHADKAKYQRFVTACIAPRAPGPAAASVSSCQQPASSNADFAAGAGDGGAAGGAATLSPLIMVMVVLLVLLLLFVAVLAFVLRWLLLLLLLQLSLLLLLLLLQLRLQLLLQLLPQLLPALLLLRRPPLRWPSSRSVACWRPMEVESEQGLPPHWGRLAASIVARYTLTHTQRENMTNKNTADTGKALGLSGSRKSETLEARLRERNKTRSEEV